MEQTNFYENTNYSFERSERKTLILDYKIGATITNISLPLYEPLIIDKLSDVYLDSFTTFRALANTNIEKSAFVINIDEFNINSNSNYYNNSGGTTVTNTFNKLVIPNEAGSHGDLTHVHKAKKMNYICTMNPTKLSTLTIKITDLNSTPDTMFNSSGRIIMEFLIIAR
tara:strand:+ start:804 stop:1310 length:507 start_codon:yes stop_codon:yes gene_type:complete